MPLSPLQREKVRGEIGQDTTVWPSDSDLDTLYDGLGLIADPTTGLVDPTPLVVVVLKERKAALLGGALQFSVAGVYSENAAETVKALERQIDRTEMGNRQLTTRALIRVNGARSFAGMPGSSRTSLVVRRGLRL